MVPLKAPKAVAGRLQYHLANWERVTKDRWVLDTVKGYLIEFTNDHYQRTRPHPPQYGAELMAQMRVELTELLQKGVVAQIEQARGGFYSTLFLMPGKRRQTTPRNKPQSAKSVHSDVPLQDGRLADAKGPDKARRLAGKGGSKGCLFRDSYRSKPQEVSTVCSGQPDLPVQLSSLWPGSSTMGLHQDPQASSGYAAPDGGSSGLLHRRHTPAGGDPDSGGGAGKGAAIPVGMSRLYCAPRQINHDPG